MSVRFTDDGWSVCACGVPGIRGAFGRLLTIVADVCGNRAKVHAYRERAGGD